MSDIIGTTGIAATDTATKPAEDELLDAFLRVSRMLLAMSARSLAEASCPVTVAQFRALLVISRGSANNQTQLAEELDVAPSSVTRMVDRLEAAELVQRFRAPGATRGLALAVSEKGAAVVEEVTANRREQISRLITEMPTESVDTLIRTLAAFADAGDGDERSLTVDSRDMSTVEQVTRVL